MINYPALAKDLGYKLGLLRAPKGCECYKRILPSRCAACEQDVDTLAPIEAALRAVGEQVAQEQREQDAQMLREKADEAYKEHAYGISDALHEVARDIVEEALRDL